MLQWLQFVLLCDPHMREVPIFKGKKNESVQIGFALVDDCDYEAVSQIKWFLRTQNHGRIRKQYAYGYVTANGKTGKMQSMHRFIMKAKRFEQVDHHDSNGLNNWRSNLRSCNHALELFQSTKVARQLKVQGRVLGQGQG